MEDLTQQTDPSYGDLPPEQVPSYMVQAILVCIFCCVFFGIPALIFAAQSDGMLKAGVPAQAMEAARKAKSWCWVSFGVGLVYILCVMGFYAFAIFGAMAGM